MANIHSAYLSSKEPRRAQPSKYWDHSFQIEDVISVAQLRKFGTVELRQAITRKSRLTDWSRPVPSSKTEIVKYSESAAKFFSFKPIQKTV